jgi:excisionase family DNA binding protein
MYTETASEYMTVAQAAELLGIHQMTLRRKVWAGEIPATQLGGPGSPIRIPRAALDAWLWSAGSETADAAR